MSLGHRVKKRIPAPARRLVAFLIRPLARRVERAQITRLYRSLVAPGDLVFDIGAHTGTMTAVLLRLGARVVAVEPLPECLRELETKFGGNRDVAIEPIGVGAAEGELTFAICDKPQGSTFSLESMRERDPSLSWSRSIPVKVSTLDRLIEKHGVPRFCKIDVEGFEPEVLKGLGRPLPFLSFEFHGEGLDRARRCADRVLELGPAVFQVSLFTQHRFHFPDWVSVEELFRALAANKAPGLCGDIYVRSSVRG